MARINIEECWWSDPRRSKLIRLLGGDTRKADGLAIEAWRLAQEFWKHERKLVPLTHFDALEDSQCLIDAGLAEVRGSEVYVRGSSQYLEWVREQRENAASAGRASAQRPRDEKGRLLPKVQQVTNETPATSSEVQPSVSGSGSIKENTIEHRKRYSRVKSDFDLEKLYKEYPRKKGKTPGLKKLAKEIKTEADYLALAEAIKNYAADSAGKDAQYIQFFSTFAGQWRDWIQIEQDNSQFSINTTPIELEAS